MVSEPPRDGYAVRDVPFEEWVDVDTLVHRTAVTSGDFDYMLHPLCPDCGNELGLDYEEIEDGVTVLSALVCDACNAVWRLSPDDDGDAGGATPGSAR
ncbi:MAG: hypothetical protein V3V06_05730 [Dehalococcoidia bacterium]